MRNEILRDADKIALPVPTDTPAGAPVLVGAFVGVTATAEGEGGNVAGEASVWRTGGYELTVTGAAASVGLPVYITSGLALTMTATGNTLFGYSLSTKGSGSGLLLVALAKV